MRVIEDIDLKNYPETNNVVTRIAVRAIIYKEDKLALVKSAKYGELKFPGGGKENYETDVDALVRETKEETGLIVIKDTIVPYGISRIKRNSIFSKDEIFYMESRYYLCEVEDEIGKQDLQGYEIELGYKLVFLKLDEAIKVQTEILKSKLIDFDYLKRELNVLKDLEVNLSKYI